MPEYFHPDATLPQLVKLLAAEAGHFDELRFGLLHDDNEKDRKALVIAPPDPDELMAEAMDTGSPIDVPHAASWASRLPLLIRSRNVGADYPRWPQPGVLVTVARLLAARPLESGEREIHSSVTYRYGDGQPFTYMRRTERDTEPEPAPTHVVYVRVRRNGTLSHLLETDFTADAQARELMAELAAIIQSQQFARSARRIGEECAAHELAAAAEETVALEGEQEDEPNWEPTCEYLVAWPHMETIPAASEGEVTELLPGDDLPF